MSTLTETLKKMLNALACADAAEFLTPGQKTECLNRAMGIPAVARSAEVSALLETEAEASASSAGRRVAFYMGSELHAEVLQYVAQTCARLNHGLTVLTFQSESAAQALLKPHLEELAAAGIDMQLEALTGEPVQGLNRYLRKHPEIAFLACRETGYLGRSFLNGTQRQNALPVPVVLVESQQDSVRKQKPASSPASSKDAANVAHKAGVA